MLAVEEKQRRCAITKLLLQGQLSSNPNDKDFVGTSILASSLRGCPSPPRSAFLYSGINYYAGGIIAHPLLPLSYFFKILPYRSII